MRSRRWIVALTVLAAFGPGGIVHADEGMWLFNQPPRKLLKERYDFEATDAWLEHLQKASIRFNSGGSGSFVSADGLVMTNHHVAADALQKLSTAEKDLLKEGFHAADRAAELKCVDLELNVLMSIEDVTEKINGAVKKEMTPAEAQQDAAIFDLQPFRQPQRDAARHGQARLGQADLAGVLPLPHAEDHRAGDPAAPAVDDRPAAQRVPRRHLA